MGRESAIMNLGYNHNAIIDLEDLPRLSLIRWFAEKRPATYYACCMQQKDGVRKKVYMHRYIMGELPEGKETDHINGNGLDNRKENLRFCTHRQNLQARRKMRKDASSKYKGVSWHRQNKKWIAGISHSDGIEKHLGCFESELDAAKAYDVAALEMFGKFATLNFPKPAEYPDRLFPER